MNKGSGSDCRVRVRVPVALIRTCHLSRFLRSNVFALDRVAQRSKKLRVRVGFFKKLKTAQNTETAVGRVKVDEGLRRDEWMLILIRVRVRIRVACG